MVLCQRTTSLPEHVVQGPGVPIRTRILHLVLCSVNLDSGLDSGGLVSWTEVWTVFWTDNRSVYVLYSKPCCTPTLHCYCAAYLLSRLPGLSLAVDAVYMNTHTCSVLHIIVIMSCKIIITVHVHAYQSELLFGALRLY